MFKVLPRVKAPKYSISLVVEFLLKIQVPLSLKTWVAKHLLQHLPSLGIRRQEKESEKDLEGKRRKGIRITFLKWNWRGSLGFSGFLIGFTSQRSFGILLRRSRRSYTFFKENSSSLRPFLHMARRPLPLLVDSLSSTMKHPISYSTRRQTDTTHLPELLQGNCGAVHWVSFGGACSLAFLLEKLGRE